MQSEFIEKTLRIVVGSICQNIGFQGIFSTPLNLLTDLLHRYLREIAITTHRYGEHDGRAVPNLDDLEIAFRDMGISISELEEYVQNVDPVPYPHEVPRIPLPRPSNLNFIKPGAKEIVSRSLHINEHLPPMYPEKEDVETNLKECLEEENTMDGAENEIRKINDTSPTKHKVNVEAEGEPVREIDSVMMTTSGFISSAREGKLPEAKRPNLPLPLSRSSSPVNKSPSSLIKKKVTMEKIIRHKNHQGGIRPVHLPKPKLKETIKLKPKIPSIPPGTGSLSHIRAPGGIPPKLKIPVPVPQIKPEENEKKELSSSTSTSSDRHEKRRRRDEKRREQKRRDRKINEDSSDSRNKDRVRIRMRGLSKEEELQRYKERENELIAKLAASSAVTVTSIPPPSLRVREKTPDMDNRLSSPSSSESKSKLSVFSKSKPSKESKHHSRSDSPALNMNIDTSTPVIKEEPFSPPSSPPPMEFTAIPQEHISPPRTPSLPVASFIPNIPEVSTPKKPRSRNNKPRTERKSAKSKVSPNMSRIKSKKSQKTRKKVPVPNLSPQWKADENCFDTSNPKTPEGVPVVKTPTIIPLPNSSTFIPPLENFLYSMNPISHMYSDSPQERKDTDRPITPAPTYNFESPITHNRSDPPSFYDDNALHETPKALEKEPPSLQISPKLVEKNKVKIEKEKKKEHKKEKKQKEKEKIKKKREKDKAKEERKKEKERLKQEKRDKKRKVIKDVSDKAKESVPKITLKFQSGDKDDTSTEIKHTPKLVIKPVVKTPVEKIILPTVTVEKRIKPPELSLPLDLPRQSIKLPPEDQPGSPPEIAKFSPLITRPPKGSQSKKNSSSNGSLTVPPLKIKDPSLKLAKKEFKIKDSLKMSKKELNMKDPSLKISKKELKIKEKEFKVSLPTITSIVPPLKIRSADINKFTEEKKITSKAERKEKRKRTITPPPMVPPPAPVPIVEVIKPPPPEPAVEPPRKRICVPPPSPPQTATGPSSGLLTETVGPIGHFVDDQGNEVWICPTCGKQDDGSPMIGCDTCDDWYHWLCVGIHVPPNERENWYCPRCLSQQKHKGGFIERKKRGRKRKFPPV